MSLCLIAFNQFFSHWCMLALKPSKHLAFITIGLLMLFYVYSGKRAINSERFFLLGLILLSESFDHAVRGEET